MTTIGELINGFPMPHLTRFQRTIPASNPDPYTGTVAPARTPAVQFDGALASSTSTRTQQETGATVTTDAVLTIPLRELDLKPDDIVTAVPSDGRRWRVIGYATKDVNPFTGWQPTLQVRLEEVRGA